MDGVLETRLVWGLLIREPNMWASLAALALLATQAEAVDKAKFRRCQDTGFCKRHRTPETSPPAYAVEAESVVQHGADGVTARPRRRAPLASAAPVGAVLRQRRRACQGD